MVTGTLSHERIQHLATPENVGLYRSPRELLPARDHPGLFCQAVYGPENRLVAQVPGVPNGEETLLTSPEALLVSLQYGLAHHSAQNAWSSRNDFRHPSWCPHQLLFAARSLADTQQHIVHNRSRFYICDYETASNRELIPITLVMSSPCKYRVFHYNQSGSTAILDLWAIRGDAILLVHDDGCKCRS